MSYKGIHLLEQRNTLLRTGCKIPCTYMAYELVDNSFRAAKSKEVVGFGIAYSTTVVSVHKEKLLYPLISFLAELGGALGMFLGFSLLMVWDMVYLLSVTIKNFQRKKSLANLY